MKESLFSALSFSRGGDDDSATMIAERVRFSYQRTLLGGIAGAIVAALLGFYLWQSSAAVGPLIWAAYCVLVGLGRVGVYVAYHRSDEVDSSPRTWLIASAVAMALTGIGWGAAVPLFYDLAPPGSALLVTVVTTAVLTVGILLLATFTSVMLAFALPIAIPLLWTLAVRGDLAGWYMLAIVTLLLATVVLHALRMRQTIAHMLGLDRDNAQLIEGLGGSKDKLEELKNELSKQAEQRAQFEAELRQAKLAAEAAVMAKDEFLATMSHEIRTPLNGILPILDILRSTQLDHNQRDYLNTAFQSSKHLLSIIDDILDYTKIEAGKLELETVGINLRELLDSVTRLMAGSASKKGVELKTLIDPDVRVAMRGDPVRLRQVLTNLVSNAIKFTEKGTVLVSISKRAETRTQVELLFSIKDTGIGMERGTAERLFQPFSQADASTTRTYGGSGLGLVICKRLVEMMSGRIGVKSEVGRGSVFWFTSQLKKSLGDIQAGGKGVSGAQILLVCPDPTRRQRLKVFLESWSSRLTEVLTLKEAAGKIRATASMGANWQYDAIVFDVESCGERVLELTTRIRNDPRLVHIGILLLTADGELPPAVAELHDVVAVNAAAAEGSLHASLEDLLSGESEAQESEEETYEDAYGVAEKVAPGPVSGTALLVEDNPVNLHVAQKLMSVIGIKYDVAKNGKEGFHMMQQRRYDVVLMDCMMPVMDGYAATREWRKYETQHTGQNRLPILAMTANAMAGDRQKCLDAGMDDYMSKPLSKQLLQQMLHRWIRSDSKAEAGPPPVMRPTRSGAPKLVARAAAGSGVIDRQVVEDLVDIMGDEFKDLIAVYLEDAPKALSKLVAAAEEDNAPGLVDPAHSLKSTSANIGALQLSQLAETIEHDARLGVAADVSNRVRNMMTLYKQVAAELEQLRAT